LKFEPLTGFSLEKYLNLASSRSHLRPPTKTVSPPREGIALALKPPAATGSALAPEAGSPLVTPQLKGLALGLDNEPDFLRAVVDSMTEPFYVWSLGGLLLMANRGWEEATGVRRESALGKSCSAIFPTEMAKRFLEVNRLVVDKGQPVQEEEFVDKPEGRVLYLTLKFPIRDKSGRIVAVGVVSLSKQA